MPEITQEQQRLLASRVSSLDKNRNRFWVQWRELAEYFLPTRYAWLHTSNEQQQLKRTNSKILDNSGTLALRVLAAGLMNGITSPSRPWFRLGFKSSNDAFADTAGPAREWLDEVERVMRMVMANSNFYNSLAINYLDISLFGTTANMIYKDAHSIIRCYVPAMGEYFLDQDETGRVNTLARTFQMTARQVVDKWGEENCSQRVLDLANNDKTSGNTVNICHIFEPNLKGALHINGGKFREYYFEQASSPKAKVLERRTYPAMIGFFGRWETSGNSPYATSCPAMDALGDVKQLQHEQLRKAQGLDKMISPPMLADVSLRNQQTSLVPNGLTYVPSIANTGMKPAYQVQLPLQELTGDIKECQGRIRSAFFNELFARVMGLDTVRSATEIAAIDSEKMTLLGPMLERFEDEALDPAIERIYHICSEADLFPPPPEEIAEEDLAIKYISALAVAQNATNTIPTERFIQMFGNVVQMDETVKSIPNWENLLRDYARDLGVRAAGINSREESEAGKAAMNQQAQEAQGIQQAGDIANAAQSLSATDVGGGVNALEQMLGGGI